MSESRVEAGSKLLSFPPILGDVSRVDVTLGCVSY
jgi:hypothetical protein